MRYIIVDFHLFRNILCKCKESRYVGIHIGDTLGEQRASLRTDRDYKSILDTSNIGCASVRGCDPPREKEKKREIERETERKRESREGGDSRHWISASCNTLSSIYICIHARTFLFRARRTRGAALGAMGDARDGAHAR